MSEKYLKDKQADRAGTARRVRDAGRQPAEAANTTPATSWWRPSRLRRRSSSAWRRVRSSRTSPRASRWIPPRTTAATSAGSRPIAWCRTFADAVMALKPGEYTHKPVQTQYGWHVIQLVDTRDAGAAAVRPGQAAPRAGRAGEEVQGLHGRADAQREDREAGSAGRSGSGRPRPRLRRQPRHRRPRPPRPALRRRRHRRRRSNAACLRAARGRRTAAPSPAPLSAALQQPQKLLLIHTAHAELAGPSELRARLRPGDHVARFLRDAAGTFAPRAISASCASSRVRPSSVPVTTKVWPASGSAAAGAGVDSEASSHLSPVTP